MGYREVSVELLIVFLCQITFSSSLCPKDQSIALLKFKKTLTLFPSSTYTWCDFYGEKSYPKTSSWNISRDCCLWDGVKCNEMTGHVIELDLSCSQLVGVIDLNSSLFQLSHLQRLDLSFNTFYGSQISPKFGMFSSLTHLDLSFSHFSGQIPSEISRLSKLQYLHVHGGSLRLESLSFKLILQNLTQLRDLNLPGVNISSTIPHNFSSHLTTLRLLNTGLYGIIPENIFHLPNLKILELYQNDQLTGSFPKIKWNSSASLMKLDLGNVNFSDNLPDSFGYLTSTHYLSLRYCNLWGPIPKSLSNLTHLEHLYLSDNSLNGTIPSGMFSHTSLRVLSLSNNHFSGQLEDFKSNSLIRIELQGNQLQGHLPKSIRNLVDLTDLDLSFNNFSGHVDVSLFSDLKQLSHLSLSHNSLSLTNEKEVNSALPESLKRLGLASCEVKELEFLRSAKKLSDLDLTYNKIQGSIPGWAWSNWMFSLRFFNISHNMLTSMGSIPLRSVDTIDLRSNLLQGSLPIPPTSTSYFDISHNNFSGEIPSSICNLMSLRMLDLERNNLRGAIPHCLANVSSLQVLIMSHNTLSGEIPPSFCNFPSLRILNLGRNNLKGAILHCLGNMSDLEVFDIQRNSLSGTLPTTFKIGSSLKSLNLHGNELEGNIPRSLANCKELQVLDLGDNHLNDTFPMWLGALPNLRVLSLRLNKLHGPIRTSRNENMFHNLQIIDVSYNAFSGNLPESLFQHLKAMGTIVQTMKLPSDGLRDRYYEDSVVVVTKGLELEVVRILSLYTAINLSNNKFEGHIPSALGDLIALRVLSLSHNGLQGHIPPSLGYLPVVESLDLSFNKLSGKIPQQLASLTYLAFLNLSYNHLEGCIPQGNQMHTFEKNSYEGNDGLRGFPISEGCGNDRVPETDYNVSVLDDEENDSQILNDFWKAALMGYGSGLCVGLAIVYIMTSTGNMRWFARIIEELEHKIIIRRRKKQRGQRDCRRSNNHF
ncbi:unnamed protein product [Withania somnifera]